MRSRREPREPACQHPGFEDTTWCYLIAYETDAKEVDSWEDLKTKAQPVVTKKYY